MNRFTAISFPCIVHTSCKVVVSALDCKLLGKHSMPLNDKFTQNGKIGIFRHFYSFKDCARLVRSDYNVSITSIFYSQGKHSISLP